MYYQHGLVFLIVFICAQASNVVYLENCTFAIDIYKEYLNVLWSSNDLRTLHIQAVYSLSANNSLVLGHIYSYLSQSVALIPLLIQCKYPNSLPFTDYLPITQCSTTITNYLTKKNYESTRTHLNLKKIFSMSNIPILYTGEYYLLLSNCSFEFNYKIYRFKSNDLFKFHIEYENSIYDNITSCHQCNRRTSTCQENKCLCRSGTIPLKLYQDKEYCVDVTPNCTHDLQRCFNSRSGHVSAYRSNKFVFILVILVFLFFLLFVFLLWYMCRNVSKHKFEIEKDFRPNQPIYMINRHERTPSTISTTDSLKLCDVNHMDQRIFANEYVSRFYEDYPKIISDQTNGEIVFILA